MDSGTTLTKDIGEYTEIAKGKSRQEQILRDFPWLWAVFNAWPILDDVRVSNDLRLLEKVFAYLKYTDNSWIKFGFRGATYVMAQEEAAKLIGLPFDGNRKVKLFPGWQWFEELARVVRAGATIENIVVQTERGGIIIFRHPQKTSFNQFISDKF